MTASELTQKINITVAGAGLETIKKLRDDIDSAGEAAATAASGNKLGGLKGVLSSIPNPLTLITAGTVAAGVAIAGMTAVAMKMGSDASAAYATLANKTGATGAELAGLESSMRAVAATSAASMGDVSNVMATLASRTELTGKSLEAMTKQQMALAKVTGTDVAQNITLTTRLFGDWGVATENQAGTLDMLFRASQQTGVGFDRMSQLVVQFGAKFRNFGFTLEESTAMMGKWEKEGVNTELVMGSLGIAAGKFAKDGIDLKVGLNDTINSIKNAGSASEATAIAMETFGARAGADMADTIRGGKFEIDDLVKSIETGKGTIADAGAEAAGIGGAMKAMAGSFAVALSPITDLVFDLATAFAKVLVPAVGGAGASIGDSLAPLADSIRSVAMPAIENLGALVKDKIIPIVTQVKAGAAELQAAFQAGGMQGFLDKLSSLTGIDIAGTVGKIVVAVTSLSEKISQVDWGALFEKAQTVGEFIVGVFTTIAKHPAVATIAAVIGTIAIAFATVMAIVGPFIPIIMGIVGALGGLLPILGTVAAVLTGPVGIAIALVIGAFVLWKAKGEEIKAALSAVATAIGEKFTQLKAELSQAWEDIKAAFNAAGQFIASQADLIKAVLLTIVTGGLILVYAGWVQYGDQIKAKAAEIVAWIKQKWEDLKAGTFAKWNEIKAAVGAAIEATKAKITEVLSAIRAAWDAAWSGLGALAETAWNNMVATITAVWGIIRGLVETGVNAVRDTVRLGFDTVLASVDAVWFAIGQVVEAGMIFIRGIASAAMKLLQGDFSGAWAAVKQTVAIGIENVKIVMNNILNHIGNLAKNTLSAALGIGKAVGDGIRQGLEGAWELVLGKLRGLVDLLPQFVKDQLGIHSPSTVFAEIGTWITLGLASGIQKSDQKAVAALADVIGKMVSVANGLADFGKKIAEAIVPTDQQLATAKEKYLRMTLILTDFIKSISYLGALLPVANVGMAGPGQIKAINAGLVQLSQGFPAIKELQGMVAENLLTGGEASWASQLADMVGKIAGVWGGLADNMTKMASAVFPSDAQLDKLKESTIRIALWAADSLKNPTLPAVGAAEFAASMKSISDALGTVAGLNLAEIAEITEKQLRLAGANIVLAGGWAKAMVEDWLAKAGTAEQRAAFLASLREFADTAGAAANVLKAGDIGDLSELAELLPDQLRTLGANIVMAGGWAKAMVEDWLKTAPSPEDRAKWVANMQDFAAMIGAAVNLAKAAAIGELKAEIEADVVEIRAVLNWVRNNLMPDMVKVADAWKETAEEAKRQTEHMQAFASWLSAAIGLAKVADIGVLKGDIEADVIELRAVLNWVKNHIAPEMQKVADAWEVASKEAALMSERMQSFGGWLSAAVGLAKVADIGTLKGDIEADVIELRAVLNWVKNNLAPEMVKVAEGWGETSEATKAMVEKMQSFGSYITAAVNLAKAADIGTLATVTGTTDLGAKLKIVKENVLAVFGMVGELALGITTAEATARADLAEALGRGMKALGDFGGGITSLMDLAESKLFGSTAGTPGLGHTQRTRTNRADFYAQQLRDTVQRAVQAMQEALAGINIAPNDPKTEAIKQLGEAFGALANGLKAVAETKLPNAQQLAALVAALNGGGGSLGLAGAGAGAGGGAFSIASVRADTATIEGVSIGAVNLTAAVHIDGREIARAVASAMITDVQILDDLGKALGERQARRP